MCDLLVKFKSTQRDINPNLKNCQDIGGASKEDFTCGQVMPPSTEQEKYNEWER
jgi:hypothetical protein